MKIARLFLLVMLVATVSAMAVNPGSGSLGSGTPSGQDTLGGSNSTTCDWYWIDCGMDGIDDWCCADFDGCAGYCERLCGGPCDYYPNQT